MKFSVLMMFACFSFALNADTLKIDDVEFVYRVPRKYDADSAVMVLFGGRNWPGAKTLETYDFNALADKHKLFLLSPSFVDKEYWQPEKWSGVALKKAIARLVKYYGLKPPALYFYGYSAGGQCANLFYEYMPERVKAWGTHACGVFFSKEIRNPAPALITCGMEDLARLHISRQFIYRYRESGGELLWKYYPSGHELNPEALELARTWFDMLLSGISAGEYGEDDTGLIRKDIDPEFRNPLTPATRELWLK